MDPSGEKELPETRKEERRPPVFLDIATLFLATSSQRRAVGRFCMHWRVCILGREAVTFVGERRERVPRLPALPACRVLIPALIPASGVGDAASMLSPKGKPWKGGGLRVGARATDGERGAGRQDGRSGAAGRLGDLDV